MSWKRVFVTVRLFSTQSKEKSVVIAVSNPLFAEDTLPEILMVTDSGVEVAKEFMVSWNSLNVSVES